MEVLSSSETSVIRRIILEDSYLQRKQEFSYATLTPVIFNQVKL